MCLLGIVLVFSFKAWAVGTLISISSATYNSPADGDDNAFGVVVDGDGNIIVTGSSSNGTNHDYYTIKYNNDFSLVLASATYNGPADGDDYALGVAVDGDGNIIVIGYSHNGTNHDYYTIKYNPNLSSVLASATYNGSANGDDYAREVAIDGNGNIIVIGYSHNGTNYDYFSIKYNNDFSLVLASATYNSPADGDDNAFGVVVDGDGNIIVTGSSSNGTNNDYLSIKYNSDFSLVLASATYNGSANGFDMAYGVIVDGEGNIIVTGNSFNGTNHDYYTIKYNNDFSLVLASATYNGPADGTDVAIKVAVDGDGDIFVTGYSSNGTNYDYYTIKYNNDFSLVLALATYNGPADGTDVAIKVAVDGDGDIFVTGYSPNGTNHDYYTIKYNGSPQIFSLSPSFGRPGETLDLIINGSNFYSGADISFSDSGIIVNSVNFISAMEIRANITIAQAVVPGNRDVVVTNIDEARGVMAGRFEIRENIGYQVEADFRLVKVSPRIFTPNGDGINDVANFIFENSQNEEVTGMIFDLSGSIVRDVLVQNSDTSLMWDGRDNNGNIVSGKVYIYQIKAGNKLLNGTVVLAK